MGAVDVILLGTGFLLGLAVGPSAVVDRTKIIARAIETGVLEWEGKRYKVKLIGRWVEEE